MWDTKERRRTGEKNIKKMMGDEISSNQENYYQAMISLYYAHAWIFSRLKLQITIKMKT